MEPFESTIAKIVVKAKGKPSRMLDQIRGLLKETSNKNWIFFVEKDGRNKTMIKVAKPCHQAASKKGEQIEKAKCFKWSKSLIIFGCCRMPPESCMIWCGRTDNSCSYCLVFLSSLSWEISVDCNDIAIILSLYNSYLDKDLLAILVSGSSRPFPVFVIVPFVKYYSRRTSGKVLISWSSYIMIKSSANLLRWLYWLDCWSYTVYSIQVLSDNVNGCLSF